MNGRSGCAVICGVLLLGLVFPAGCAIGAMEQTETTVKDSAARDFSFGYWLNGWRKSPGDKTPDVLCFETGRYGFMLDLANLSSPLFGLLDDNSDYENAVADGAGRLESLDPAQLFLELKLGDKVYRAVSTRPGSGPEPKHPGDARMWESGRIAQHYDLRGLRFEDAEGAPLACDAKLEMVAWSGSLAYTLDLAPEPVYANGPSVGVVGNGLCIVDKPLDIPHSPGLEPAALTVECWIRISGQMNSNTYGWILCKNKNEHTAGNYGFMFRRRVTAVLNNLGGRAKKHMIRQRGLLRRREWHHLALTYDGTTMRFYVDGRQHGKKTIGEHRVPGSGALRIGQRADGNFDVVGALYDQVRVWNRALPADEIAAHTKYPGQLPSHTGLVLEKNFDDGKTIPPPTWNEAELRLRFKTAEDEWHTEKHIAGAWSFGQRHALTLNCDLDACCAVDRDVTFQVSTPDGQQFPVVFNPVYNCYVAEVKGLKRSFSGGYTKITDYDEFDIVLDCFEETPKPVPFLFDLRRPANITGLVPILCRPDGTPTGVPVQLSKNWHYPPTGPYLRAYALVPVKQGQTHYRLRIPYGFYGTLPSVSHAQLCLIGYGGNQRWDQLAMACGGESITFDVDMSLTDVAVCDVRVPLGRDSSEGNPWGWTEAGWGGDWLGVRDVADNKLPFAGMKVAYLAHGPCLSDVVYKGACGSGRSVLLDARIQLPRTDDYARTFQKLEYCFQKELNTSNSYFLKRHARQFDSLVTYGNGEGLIAEKRVAPGMKPGDLLIPPTELKGPGPWWVAFPERDSKPTGYVSIIIRDYDASFDGSASRHPYLATRIEKLEGDQAKVETLLVPPPDLKRYQPGDRVMIDAEWIHLVTRAGNYGGPNEAFRKHLTQYPHSWETTYREVQGNDLTIEVEGGTLLQELPIMIRVDEGRGKRRRAAGPPSGEGSAGRRSSGDAVVVSIKGGIGHVPIRFEGLTTPEGYAIHEMVDGAAKELDQSVHGNDFWQTDYDPGTSSYKITFNLPLDGKNQSRWIFKR